MNWVHMVTDLYQRYGKSATIKTLYNIEKPGMEVLVNKGNGYQCPVCGMRFYNTDISYCPVCGTHFVYDKQDSIFAEIETWNPAGVVPSIKTRSYLVCNIWGDKYLAHYDKKKNTFLDHNREDGNILLAYVPIEDPEEEKILECFCTRERCMTCGNLSNKNGILECPYEENCGAYRFKDPLPVYKLPFYTEKKIDTAASNSVKYKTFPSR